MDNPEPEHPRKKRNVKQEQSLRHSVGVVLKPQWGDYQARGQSLLLFPNIDKKVLCKFSSYRSEEGRWFWGVAKKDWAKWSKNDYLALVLENEDKSGFSYMLFDPEVTTELFKKCSRDQEGSIKINMRFYKNDSKPRIQEWQEFSTENIIKDLPLVQNRLIF